VGVYIIELLDSLSQIIIAYGCFFNPLSVNVEYTPHDAEIVCSGCITSHS